ncbi:MAG: hypothetical protein KAT65_07275 [Methanophagales archaeon]|nr:hypothetical protein [Methanophagales archaeon]
MLEQSEMVGIIIALVGIFIGVIIVLVVNIIKIIGPLNKELQDIKESIKEIRRGPFVLPFPNEFLKSLATHSKFWEKLFIQRADKVSIASTIASRYIQDNDTIIVDSGTTVDLIPSILRDLHPNVKVYTNNLLAAMSVVPPEDFDCSILSGRIDPIFGATYNIRDIGEPLKSIDPDQIILAAGGISFEKGPLVHVKDANNRQFKQELVEKAFLDLDTRLIIAVDWKKFKKDSDKLSDMNPVLGLVRWREVKGTNRFVLVTTNPPPDLRTPEAVEAREVIKKFFDNMNKKEGMNIEAIEAISWRKSYRGA